MQSLYVTFTDKVDKVDSLNVHHDEVYNWEHYIPHLPHLENLTSSTRIGTLILNVSKCFYLTVSFVQIPKTAVLQVVEQSSTSKLDVNCMDMNSHLPIEIRWLSVPCEDNLDVKSVSVLCSSVEVSELSGEGDFM
mmetsp:Transcript_22619/g.27301  ORF Transcript_22619/g.27301 Transcript_22619/m.27301 type:complete len:135 (+) Transcript_22619:59-463(+)